MQEERIIVIPLGIYLKNRATNNSSISFHPSDAWPELPPISLPFTIQCLLSTFLHHSPSSKLGIFNRDTA